MEVLNPEGSDHFPLYLQYGLARAPKPKPFKFLNCLVGHPSFSETVARVWNMECTGVQMFRVWTKLKQLHLFLGK